MFTHHTDVHGIIFDELESFVVEEYGEETWDDLVAAADTEHDAYLPTKSYPDSDLVAIVTTASETTGIPIQDLLYAFGEYAGPHLIEM